MRRIGITLTLAACGTALGLFTAVAHAGDSKVNCNSPGANGKIANVLSRLDPAATNVVHVSGHCHQNVVIRGFDRLSLIGERGAVIEDASGGQAAVVDIGDSQRVVLQDFTVLGGSNGVSCSDFSFCRLLRVNIEQTAAGAGLFLVNSQGQFTGTVQDSLGEGIFLFGGKLQVPNVTVSNARGNGIHVDGRSQLNGPNITVKGSGGTGIMIINGSSLTAGNIVATGNFDGIYIAEGSNASVGPITVTDNQRNGIYVADGSNANLNSTTVTNNGTNDPNGVGVLVQASHVSLFGGLVTDNRIGGIFIQWESSLFIGGASVTNNHNFGVLIDNVSFAWVSSGTFTGQVGDIICGQQFAAAVIESGTQYGSLGCPVPSAAARPTAAPR